jgi:hypothetical protein
VLDGEWYVHSYVNEIPLNFSSGTGLASVKADEKVSIGKASNVVVPSNGTLRILLVGFEQDNTNTKLPYIKKDLEQAIPNIKIAGIEVGGKMIAAWYNISQTLINYDNDDPIGILSKVYNIDNNFGVGTHSNCARANENINDIQKQQSTSCDFILNYEIMDLNHKLPKPSWHDWEVMDGIPQTTANPAAVSNVPGQFKMAGLNQEGEFFVLPYDYGWQEVTTLGRETSGSEFFSPAYNLQPAILTESPDRIFVFALGSDKSVWYSWFSEQEGTWSKWINSGGSFVSAPTALLIARHTASVYGVGADNFIWEREMDLKNAKWISNTWTRQASMGDEFKSSPTFVSPRGKSNSLDAFALAKNGSIWHGTFTKVTAGGPWPFATHVTWNLGKGEYLTNNLTNNSKFVSQPGAAEILYGNIGLFAQTGDNKLVQKTYNYFNETWSEKKWSTLGKIFESPSLATPSSYRTDIFARNGSSIIHKWYGN